MLGDIEMNDTATLVAKDDEDEQNSEGYLGCLLEPAGDGVPGNPFDPGNRGNADTLDSESDDPIESSSSMLETVVGACLSSRRTSFRTRRTGIDGVSRTWFGRIRGERCFRN